MRVALVPTLAVPPYDVSPDVWWPNVLAEASASFAPLLWGAFLVAVLVRRRLGKSAGTRSLRGAAVLLIVHVASLPVLGELARRGAGAYPDVRLVSLALASCAAINIVLLLAFDGLLRLLSLRAPRILSDVLAALAYAIAMLVLLTYRGVNLSGLIATSAVLTAVIGLALQDTLGNITGGITLQLEDSVRVGDWIRIDEYVGRVVEIRWRQTALETRNWETLIVPNSLLSKNRIVVLGRRVGAPLQLRRSVPFNVDFRYPPTAVAAAIDASFTDARIRDVAASPAPNCVLLSIDTSYNAYAVRYWLTDLSVDEGTDSVIRHRIFVALERAGIPLSIPAQAVFVTQDSAERRERKQRSDIEERRRALRAVDLFDGLPADELDELADGLAYAPFGVGEPITRQGEPGADLYVVAAGRVGIFVADQGRDQQVATLEAGAFFGERSLMTGEPRNATAVAQTRVVGYRLDKAVFARVLQRRPELADHCAEVLARRESELSRLLANLDRAARASAMADTRRRLGATIRSFFGLE